MSDELNCDICDTLQQLKGKLESVEGGLARVDDSITKNVKAAQVPEVKRAIKKKIATASAVAIRKRWVASL